MHRRQYLARIGSVGVVALAGCDALESNDAEVDGDIVLDEDVVGNGEYPFDAEAEDVINISVENENGQTSQFTVTGPESELESVEISDEEVSPEVVIDG